MTEYVLITSNICLNDCVCCCFDDDNELANGFQNIGKNDLERKVIENFIDGLDSSKDIISITGRDPLLNRNALELIGQYSGEKTIILNPLSFLALGIKKRASQITSEEAFDFLYNCNNKGLPENISELIEQIKEFKICISIGYLQSPNPQIIEYAKQFFSEYVEPELQHELKVREYEFILEGGKLKKCDFNPVGRFKKIVFEEGLDCYNNVILANDCCEKDTRILYFSDDHLHLLPCCNMGSNEYVAYKTNLTLAKLAKKRPKKILKLIEKENQQFSKTALGFHCSYDRITKKRKKLGHYWRLFWAGLTTRNSWYINAAEELLEQKIGQRIDIVSKTPSLNDESTTMCNCCGYIGDRLSQANVSVQEWQDYLENHLDKKLSQ